MKTEKEKRRESSKRICDKYYPNREWGKPITKNNTKEIKNEVNR